MLRTKWYNMCLKYVTSLSLLDIYPEYSRKWDKLKNFS
jgi:hypothetical protein